jgi:hypothetical protein
MGESPEYSSQGQASGYSGICEDILRIIEVDRRVARRFSEYKPRNGDQKNANSNDRATLCSTRGNGLFRVV